MPFFKLKLENDWGSYRYVVHAGGKNRIPELKAQEKVHVRFKDGSEARLSVISIPEAYPVCDMGHDYTVATERLYLRALIHGTPALIPLEEIEVFIKGDKQK